MSKNGENILQIENEMTTKEQYTEVDMALIQARARVQALVQQKLLLYDKIIAEENAKDPKNTSEL